MRVKTFSYTLSNLALKMITLGPQNPPQQCTKNTYAQQVL